MRKLLALVFIIFLLVGCGNQNENAIENEVGVLPWPPIGSRNHIYRQDFPEEGIRCYFVRYDRGIGFSCLPLEAE